MKFEELMQRQHEEGYTEGLEQGRDSHAREMAHVMKSQGYSEEEIQNILKATAEKDSQK